MNISFYRYGRLEGTFGQNQEGRDAKGKLHKPQFVVRRDYVGMLGGVFLEGNARSQPHFYIVTPANYDRMLAYARSRAQTTATSETQYWLLGQNCVDFVRDVFYHADLPAPVRDVDGRVKDKSEWVAIYASFSYHILTFPKLPGADDPTHSAYSRLAAAR